MSFAPSATGRIGYVVQLPLPEMGTTLLMKGFRCLTLTTVSILIHCAAIRVVLERDTHPSSAAPVFDDGELNEHPENARKEVEALTELMKSPHPVVYSAEQYPLRHVFQSVWQRIVKVRMEVLLLYMLLACLRITGTDANVGAI